MKKIKSLLALVMCTLVAFSMTACGNPYSDINLEDYIEVGKYKELKGDKVSVKVSKSDVKSEIEGRRQAAVTTKEFKEGTVKDGDTANIDYTGSIDGVKFDGGTAEGYDLVIGSGTFIDDFEDQLIGLKVGNTKNIKVTFPKDYSSEELAGKNAIFAVKINSIKKEVVPDYDEEFIKSDSEGKCATKAEYEKFIKEHITEQKTKEKEAQLRTELWTKVVDGSKLKKDEKKKEKYPEEKLNDVIAQYTTMYEEYASSSSMSLEDFVAQNFGMDMETFNKQLKELAKILVKEELVTYAIADAEGIKVNKADKKAYVEELLAQYGYTPESFKEANGKSYEEVEGKENIEKAALKYKVQKFIQSQAKLS